MGRRARCETDPPARERGDGEPEAIPVPGGVIFVPPATSEEELDALRRWANVIEWLATIGALDS